MLLIGSDVPLVTELLGGYDHLRRLNILSLEILLWNREKTGDFCFLGPDFLLQLSLGPWRRWGAGKLQQAETGLCLQVLFLLLPLSLNSLGLLAVGIFPGTASGSWFRFGGRNFFIKEGTCRLPLCPSKG